ncbi:MAG: Mur ligase domain-containing protein [Propionibacteriaceae bacterium]|jgi:UDP-N-acetylmuramate--alanine ligase|nr:Mur ligase domain-containing protein [Propionibacteriaceae bacterium]
MRIFFSGVLGAGIGPLARLAADLGHTVYGSDAELGDAAELTGSGATLCLGKQDGGFLRELAGSDATGIDWYVHTSALAKDHPELATARDLDLKVSKRDELLAYLIETSGLELVAVAGTHGKTTTSSMLAWAMYALGLPAAYIVGGAPPWGPAGSYQDGARYFIYEADEYDRNFLAFHPWLTLITSVSWDHPDVYPTAADYYAAFEQFRAQSRKVIEGLDADPRATVFGAVRRIDATLAVAALREMLPDKPEDALWAAVNSFPGVGRRSEQLLPGLYSDHVDHPDEVVASMEIAREVASASGFKGVAAIYQPHQNTRQHLVRHMYRDTFADIAVLRWLPTFLTREDPTLPIITPEEFLAELSGPVDRAPGKLDDTLSAEIARLRADGYLVWTMGSGSIDGFVRAHTVNHDTGR